MPEDVDDAYQVYANGQYIGEFGHFSARGVTFINAQPRALPLPASLRGGPVVLAVRFWMDASTPLIPSMRAVFTVSPSSMEDERAAIGTLAKRITTLEEIEDPNVVKVVFNDEGFALYFSRSPIPYHRDMNYAGKDLQVPESFFYKHIGIYAYRKDALLRFSQLAPSRLEEIEKLEQLRALERGFKIKVRETYHETIGVDTAMDLERVEKCLNLSL